MINLLFARPLNPSQPGLLAGLGEHPGKVAELDGGALLGREHVAGVDPGEALTDLSGTGSVRSARH